MGSCPDSSLFTLATASDSSDANPARTQVTSPALNHAGSTTLQAIVPLNNSTWAARNPGRPVIPTREPPPRLSDAQKASRQIAAEQKASRAKLLQDAIAKLVADHEDNIKALARAHNVPEKQVKDLIGSHTHYHTKRKPQVLNALVHVKAKEVNQNLPPGSRYKLMDIKEMIKSEKWTFTEEEKDEAVKDLLEHRATQCTGVRANNTAAARDGLATITRITKELDVLYERTGLCSSLFVTRSHVNDTFSTSWFATNNDATDFWEDVMNLRPDDISRHYEQWACALGKNISQRDSLANMRKEVTKLISTGLNYTTGKDIKMNYLNYEYGIVESHGVRLLGWPSDVPFTSPSNIGTVREARKLRDDLKSGACHWRKLTQRELNEFSEELKKRRNAGETIGVACQKRSDAGTARGPKRKASSSGTNKESGRSSKKKRVGGSSRQALPKSAETIESSDDEDEEDEDEQQ
ncbi:hypothetical protein BJ138DRAFT_1012744 [Hygrophoropsis aurantiaca]|uniref:Uncharacterized protein n=1 Tax=Hygrophoropsis aurantiaca TaxID=72124 RepID=A0ACB8A5V4_9AGAM|nr:hypothetical protein BJ138DRAFT_1012744 [Hygrophoropsis aurantiaca]